MSPPGDAPASGTSPDRGRPPAPDPVPAALEALLPTLGACPQRDGATRFRVWAPNAPKVTLELYSAAPRSSASAREGAGAHDEPGAARAAEIPLAAMPHGYFEATVPDAPPGTRYAYRLGDGPARPDPASRSQPGGVHAPSEVVDATFPWTDHDWVGRRLEDLVFYELHVGAFTREGTFDAVIPHLDRLAELGITAIELMPVAAFPGVRNWGYDGVLPFAAQESYGGPDAFRRLVNACHARGLALALDVVYNHLGPEGNYFAEFGPYFSDRYHTPWGGALNFDGPDSDDVRRFFIENALYWTVEMHVDILRLDAVHAIYDASAYPFLHELADTVHEAAARLERRLHLVAESDLNDPRLVRPPELGGFGLNAQWTDDFHHALHALLTGEDVGYYADFGRVEHLARAFRHGYVYTGGRSRYRGRRHGAPPDGVPPRRFVVYAQDHDQVGNRAGGERLSELVPFDALKLAAAAVLLSPFTPLLFMGEEYGEPAPFPYFVSHGDPALIETVRKGRAAEFAAFEWEREIPDPQSEETFRRARIDPELRAVPPHSALHAFHAELLRLRREEPALRGGEAEEREATAWEAERVLLVLRRIEGDTAALVLALGPDPVALELPLPPGRWHVRLDSARARWSGPGPAMPAEVASDGRVEVRLPGYTALLLVRG